MEMITKIVIGALAGVVTGSLNNFLLVLFVNKALAGDAKRGRRLIYLSIFGRMLGVILAVFLTFLLSGRDRTIIFSMLSGLGVMTLFSPARRYKAVQKKGGR